MGLPSLVEKSIHSSQGTSLLLREVPPSHFLATSQYSSWVYHLADSVAQILIYWGQIQREGQANHRTTLLLVGAVQCSSMPFQKVVQ